MSVLTMIKEIKEIHPDYVAIIKIGSFYNVYMKDAYILSHIFGYKLRDMEQDVKSVGFPIQTLNRVISTLENRKINYLIIDRRNNYEVDEKFELGNLNRYKTEYSKAKKIINLKIRIEKLSQYLYNNLDNKNINELIRKMEQVIYE